MPRTAAALLILSQPTPSSCAQRVFVASFLYNPHLNGLELLKVARQRWHGIPFVMLTINDTVELSDVSALGTH